MNFDNSIDSKNRNLLNELTKAGVEIDFEENTDFKSWAVQPKYKYRIVAPNKESDPEALTHELLHIELNILGFLHTNIISDIFIEENTRFSTSKLSDIQNQLAHLKMLPNFVSLGYKANDFISNNIEANQDIKRGLINLKTSFELSNQLNQKYDIKTITQFFYLFIIVKNRELENYYSKEENPNLEEYYALLKSCNEELYQRIEIELNDWISQQFSFNYKFYDRINNHLKELGYPTESEWTKWKNS